MTNAREVVRQRIGRLGERLIGKVADADAQVEKELMKEMEIAIQVKLGGGNTRLPLSKLIPPNQFFDLEEILEPYCR